MAPDNLNVRIHSLVHVQLPQPSSVKHPFLHLIGRHQSKKGASIRPRKKIDRGASQQLQFRNLGKVAREMLTLTFPTKYQSPAFDNNNNSMSNAQYPPKMKSASCFELPHITPINISLTEGTNIPPPLESPTRERPSLDGCQSTTADEDNPPSLVEPTTNSNSSQEADEELTYKPITPTTHRSSKRPSSIRKFLSRRSLNANYTNESNYPADQTRPDSSMSYASSNTCFSNGKKRNFSWLGRFGGGVDGFLKKRTSIVIEEKVLIEPPPPPPPMLPQLSQFKATIPEFDEGLGGEDLFKNIK